MPLGHITQLERIVSKQGTLVLFQAENSALPVSISVDNLHVKLKLNVTKMLVNIFKCVSSGILLHIELYFVLLPFFGTWYLNLYIVSSIQR